MSLILLPQAYAHHGCLQISIRFFLPVLLCGVNILMIIVDLVCLFLIISGIYYSQSRWAAVGFAALGFVIPLALGALAAFLFVPRSGSVVEINSVLDTIGTGVSFASPIGAVIGVMKPKPRKRPQAL